MGQSFGFSVTERTQIVVFSDEQDFCKILATNPNMTAIIGADNRTKKNFPGVFIATIETTQHTGKSAVRLPATQLAYVPGSQKYYESIAIPGVKVESVNASPGHILITLIVETGYVAEILRKQYLDSCMAHNPIGQELTVSIQKNSQTDQ